MNAVYRRIHSRLGNEPIDAWLSRWGCTFGGLALPVLALATLRTHAASRQEFVLGAAAAGVVGLLLVLLGGLGRQVHLAAMAGRAPWRVRRGELLSHAAGFATVGLGGWAVASASPGMSGAVTGALLILAAYAVILCLGCWSTVVRSLETSVSAEPFTAANSDDMIALPGSKSPCIVGRIAASDAADL